MSNFKYRLGYQYFSLSVSVDKFNEFLRILLNYNVITCFSSYKNIILVLLNYSLVKINMFKNLNLNYLVFIILKF